MSCTVGVDVGWRYAQLVAVGPDRQVLGKCRVYGNGPAGPECSRSLSLTLSILFATYPWRTATVAWVERSMGQHANSIAQLAQTAGAVFAAVPENIGLDEIRPGEWKKMLGMNGRATKLDVLEWCRREGFEAGDEHEADAYALARAVWTLSEQGVTA